MLRIILYIFSQDIYGDNGRIYQFKIHKKMLTPNYGCVGATYKFTCSDTIFTSLVMFFLYVDNHTTISFINSLMIKTLYQATIVALDVLSVFLTASEV